MKLIDGRPVDGAGVAHHVWCNNFPDSVTAPCKMCERLRANYPEHIGDESGEALMAEHFPNNVMVKA